MLMWLNFILLFCFTMTILSTLQEGSYKGDLLFWAWLILYPYLVFDTIKYIIGKKQIKPISKYSYKAGFISFWFYVICSILFNFLLNHKIIPETFNFNIIHITYISLIVYFSIRVLFYYKYKQ